MSHSTTPRIPPQPPEDWAEDLQAMLTADLGDRPRLGELNIFTTLARHPELFKTWMPFAGYLLIGGKLPFADRELGNHAFHIEFRIRPKSLGCGANRFLILGSEGAERVLHPVAQLSQHDLGHVERILGHKIYSDTFGPNQPDDLLNLGLKG